MSFIEQTAFHTVSYFVFPYLFHFEWFLDRMMPIPIQYLLCFKHPTLMAFFVKFIRVELKSEKWTLLKKLPSLMWATLFFKIYLIKTSFSTKRSRNPEIKLWTLLHILASLLLLNLFWREQFHFELVLNKLTLFWTLPQMADVKIVSLV